MGGPVREAWVGGAGSGTARGRRGALRSRGGDPGRGLQQMLRGVVARCGLLIATFIGGAANLVTIVGFMVTATSGLPDQQQGLAAGLATMSQQIGITLGIPIMASDIARIGYGVGAAGPPHPAAPEP